MAHWITDANKKRIKVAGNYSLKRKENVETIYDKDSSNVNINWGYTSGIKGGVIVQNKDFSKFKKLRVYVNASATYFSFEIDLEKQAYIYNIVSALSDFKYLSSETVCTTDNPVNDMRCVCAISNDKTKFYHYTIGYNSGTTYNERLNSTYYYVAKIEGVY